MTHLKNRRLDHIHKNSIYGNKHILPLVYTYSSMNKQQEYQDEHKNNITFF